MTNFIFETKKEMVTELIKEAASAFAENDMETLEKIITELDNITLDTEKDITYLKVSVDTLRKLIEFYKEYVKEMKSQELTEKFKGLVM